MLRFFGKIRFFLPIHRSRTRVLHRRAIRQSCVAIFRPMRCRRPHESFRHWPRTFHPI
jgi:hypothetical protein